MASTTTTTGVAATAQLLWPHLGTNTWREVAELARPGVTRTIKKVEAGEATTAALPAEIAVRFLAELDAAAARTAAAGDTRVAVTTFVGAERVTPVKRSTLLRGTLSQVVERLEGRSRVASNDVLEEYLAAEPLTRDAVAPHLIAIGTPAIAGRVLVELAERGQAIATLRLISMQHPVGLFRNRMSQWGLLERQRVAAATAASMVGLVALQQQEEGDESGPAPDPRTSTLSPDSAADLVAAAIHVGVAVRCDPEVATTAVRAAGAGNSYAAAAIRDESRAIAAFVTAATSAAHWETVETLTNTLRSANVSNTAYRSAVHYGSDTAFLAASLTALLAVAGEPQWINPSVAGSLLEQCGDSLDATTAIRMCFAASKDNPVHLLGWLAGTHGPAPTRTALHAAFAKRLHPNDKTTIAEHLNRIGLDSYVYAGNLSSEASCGAALVPLWDTLVAGHTCAAITAAAGANPTMAGLAAAYTRAINNAIGDTGHTAELWAAICTLSGTFDGTVDELVDVAGNTAFAAH